MCLKAHADTHAIQMPPRAPVRAGFERAAEEQSRQERRGERGPKRDRTARLRAPVGAQGWWAVTPKVPE